MPEQGSIIISILGVLLFLWTLPWKIYAVWHAARHDHKKWFVALLFLNTIGILEIFYIFKVLRKDWKEVKGDFIKTWKAIVK